MAPLRNMCIIYIIPAAVLYERIGKAQNLLSIQISCLTLREYNKRIEVFRICSRA